MDRGQPLIELAVKFVQFLFAISHRLKGRRRTIDQAVNGIGGRLLGCRAGLQCEFDQIGTFGVFFEKRTYSGAHKTFLPAVEPGFLWVLSMKARGVTTVCLPHCCEEKLKRDEDPVKIRNIVLVEVLTQLWLACTADRRFAFHSARKPGSRPRCWNDRQSARDTARPT